MMLQLSSYFDMAAHQINGQWYGIYCSALLCIPAVYKTMNMFLYCRVLSQLSDSRSHIKLFLFLHDGWADRTLEAPP